MKKFNLFCAAAVAAAGVAAAPASAAPVSANANGKAIILIPLKLTKVQDLDFGTVVTSAAAGSVTVDPSSGAASPSGGVTLVGTTSAAAHSILRALPISRSISASARRFQFCFRMERATLCRLPR